MKFKQAVGWAAIASIFVALGVLGTGCGGIPKGTSETLTVGAVQLQATGAGLVKADAQKTTFRIKCAICGYEEERTIDTPTAGKPFTLDWICPKCKHKQTITVQVVPGT